MTIEIINEDFVLFNGDLSIAISNDSLAEIFYHEYERDIKNLEFKGLFSDWIIDNDKCFEYLNKFLTIK